MDDFKNLLSRLQFFINLKGQSQQIFEFILWSVKLNQYILEVRVLRDFDTASMKKPTNSCRFSLSASAVMKGYPKPASDNVNDFLKTMRFPDF